MWRSGIIRLCLTLQKFSKFGKVSEFGKFDPGSVARRWRETPPGSPLTPFLPLSASNLIASSTPGRRSLTTGFG